MVPYDTFDQMRSNFQDTFKEMADRIAALELRVAQLEARPQPAQPIGGAGNWPWPTPGIYDWKVDSNGTPYRVATLPCVATGSPATVAEIMAGQQYTASVTGDSETGDEP